MDNLNTDENESFWDKYSTHFFLGIIFLMACLFALYVYSEFNNTISEVSNEVETWAQVGDFFGGILNPTFSFLALIALLYTIILQSKELRLTRKELTASKTALQSQSDSLKLQNFETTFFNLFELLIDQLQKTSINPRPLGNELGASIQEKELVGVRAFDHIAYAINMYMLKNPGSLEYPDRLAQAQIIIRRHHDGSVSIITNQLLNIFDLLQRSDVFENEKFKKIDYINMVKRQLHSLHMTVIYTWFFNIRFPEYHQLLAETNFFGSMLEDNITGLFDHVIEQYGEVNGKTLLQCKIDYES